MTGIENKPTRTNTRTNTWTNTWTNKVQQKKSKTRMNNCLNDCLDVIWMITQCTVTDWTSINNSWHWNLPHNDQIYRNKKYSCENIYFYFIGCWSSFDSLVMHQTLSFYTKDSPDNTCNEWWCCRIIILSCWFKWYEILINQTFVSKKALTWAKNY